MTKTNRKPYHRSTKKERAEVREALLNGELPSAICETIDLSRDWIYKLRRDLKRAEVRRLQREEGLSEIEAQCRVDERMTGVRPDVITVEFTVDEAE